MSLERSYGSYEEFEREELRRDRRLDLSYEELLGEFVDEGWRSPEGRREGLFEAYEDADGEPEDEDN